MKINLPLAGALLCVGAIGLGLGGCAGDIKAFQVASSLSVTQNQLDAAQEAYDGAFLTPAAAYRQLGYCATGAVFTLAKPCADRAIVAQLQSADKAVQAERASVQALITAGDNTGLAAAYTILQGLIATAEQIAIPTAAGAK